ncbi:hypothetical protein PR202_ga29269 [Eleusine coracana subsp. coracana]|uniref:Uncharacterized protein n=1 Tax=Eleusine coracana subsp. coracana TaxID=191504 RepID=A0AAV5DKP9_ELECO|nr:hypothetical protein PR202_ga29269 [Eleusine coracana subsp. coracana]
MDRFEEKSSSKRQRCYHQHADRNKRQRRKRHLYLALDDWKGGHSIHKLDPENIMDEDEEEPAAAGREHRLPEPAALRLSSPVPRCPMAFAALGNNIFVSTNPRCSRDRAPPTFIYDTETGALTNGPCIPDQLHDFGAAMAVGEKLYALTSVCLELDESPSFQVLSWAPTTKPEVLDLWDPTMEWSWNWNRVPPPPPCNGNDIVTYALHPDGRTIFMSTSYETHSLDTSSGAWRNLGDWVLPFRGQAYFDGELDAWVGLHHKEDNGQVCCCPVASRSAATERPPECRMLKEKLFHKAEEPDRQSLRTTLTYMGESKFCLVENVTSRDDRLKAVLHVTLFGLKYDHKGELQTKIHRTTRSYVVSKNTRQFSHAAFWM